jgi:prepilin-type processing-associated H-X9-DG protein
MTLYTHDSYEFFPPNRDGTQAGKVQAGASWAGGWLDFNGGNTDNTNTDLLINHVAHPYAAYVGQYLGKSAAAFKCPADQSVVNVVGVLKPRVRSVSLQNWIGGDPVSGVPGSRTWTSPSKYGTYYQKLSLVKVPSLTMMFLDEREESINDGWFATDPDNLYQLVDYPASYHGNACGISFADGHSEIHRWTDPRTMPVMKPGQPLPLNVFLGGDLDVRWIAQHAVGLTQYP